MTRAPTDLCIGIKARIRRLGILQELSERVGGWIYA